MRLKFRQGIVKSDLVGGSPDFLTINPTGLNINTSNAPIVVTLAHGNADYYISENSDVVNAWNVSASPNPVWLYWDLDVRTGVRTFGYTEVEPQHGPTAPISPVNDLHWFDTTQGKMKVYNQTSGSFLVRIRVFAAKYDDGLLDYYPLGSQVGLQSTNFIYKTGRIIYDGNGVAVRKSTGTFFTTEDQFFTSGSVAQALRLEANVAFATADESIPAFSVVRLSDFGKIELADYEDIGSKVLAVVSENAVFGDVVTIAMQGVIINPSWDWDTVGAKLWVDVNGELTDTDPNETNPLRLKQVPIARVVSNDTIIFEQGLGGKGEKGDPGSVSGVSLATTTTDGLVRLATTPANPLFPIVVGTNDPRLTDARPPQAHTHVGTDVTIDTSFDINYSSSNTQALFQEIVSELNAKTTSLGVLFGETDLGTFTGNTIPDNISVKSALQSLETAVEAAGDTSDMGIFTDGIIQDNVDLHTALQDLESESANHILILGTTIGDVDLGTLGGNIISDNNNVVGALTELQTESQNHISILGTTLGDINLGTFAENIFPDNADVKQILQQIETIITDFTIPYDFGFFIAGSITPNTIVGSFLATRNVTIQANAPNSLALCKTAPTSNISIDIEQSGANVGTVDFLAGSTSGTFTFTSQVNLTPGDTLELVSQSTADITFADISITIVGEAEATVINA